MEKYSAFRDPGTGIQPFLTPVPPLGSELLAKVVIPFGYTVGIVRTALVLILGLLYVVLVRGICLIFVPIPFIHRPISHVLTALISRLILFIIGLWWIPVELVTRKRGRAVKAKEHWKPRAGDIIVSNWVSWIEVLWLAFRYDPIFVVPVAEAVEIPTSAPATPITHTPGRRTGTGSAAISSPSRAPTVRQSIHGFSTVSLLNMLRMTGHVLPSVSVTDMRSLQDIRKQADRPIVMFPECTTGNGRGLLRFADVFEGESIPVDEYQVFVMCVRYDPPTALVPTLSHSIPSPVLNPLGHLFTLASCLFPLTISIRLLSPSESPSSPLFITSDVITDSAGRNDYLTEACATLIAQIGKMKRTGLGWEDKSAFLRFYRAKK